MHILLVEDSVVEASLLIEALRDSTLPTRMSVIGSGDQVLAYLPQQGEYRRVVRPNLILWSLPAFALTVHNVLCEIETDPALRMILVFLLTRDRNRIAYLPAGRTPRCVRRAKTHGIRRYVALLKEVASWWQGITPREFHSPRL